MFKEITWVKFFFFMIKLIEDKHNIPHGKQNIKYIEKGNVWVCCASDRKTNPKTEL